jgi:uncharacterized protein (TIGR03435 family)
MNFQPQLLALLEASLLRPLVLVAAAWLILHFLRVRHPASRHAVWTAVLVGMLALPVLSIATPDWTIPVLPWRETAVEQPADTSQPAATAANESADLILPPIVPDTETSSVSSPPFVVSSLGTLIVWGYAAGLMAMLSYRLCGWLMLRRVLSRSRSLRPHFLRESDLVVTPVAVGVLRPSVILPANWRSWNARTRRAVLAHEFAHLRRRDTWVAALARLAKCVFWFHPVAWWVSRKTSDLAELACDAVALQRVDDPAGYSRVLVDFAGAVRRSGQRVALPGLAIASGSRIGERVDEIFELSGGTMRKLSRPGVWLLATGLPALALAATVVLSASGPAEQQPAAGSKFDAVSIKPCPSPSAPGTGRGSPPYSPRVSPGYVYWDCISLYELIHQAYAGSDSPLLNNRIVGFSQGDPWLVQGGPDWIMKDRFVVEGRISGEAPRPDLSGSALSSFRLQELAPALRTLLEDRFQLKLRRVTGQRPMYALTVAKGGLKLEPATPGDCWDFAARPDGSVPSSTSGRGGVVPGVKPADAGGKPRCGAGFGGLGELTQIVRAPVNGVRDFQGGNITMQEFARFLSRQMDRWVLDWTGTDTRFTFRMRYIVDEGTPGTAPGMSQARPTSPTRAGAVSRDTAPQPPADGHTIFEALTRIGLQLTKTNGPAEHFAIQSVQRLKPDSPTASSSAQASAAQQKFEAVSIRPCATEAVPPAGQGGRAAGPGSATTSPGRARWECATLGELIQAAHANIDDRLLNSQTRQRPGDPKIVRGGPPWVYSEKFTIEVSAAGDVARATMVGPMLRALLEDRFQLETHRETEERTMYALTVAKGGPKLARTAPGDCNDDADKERAARGFESGGPVPCGNLNMTWNGGNRRLALTGVTLKNVAEGFLSGLVMDRFVLDRTNLEGKFNVVIVFAPDDSTPGGAAGLTWARREGAEKPTGPSIFTAFEEQLGLKIVTTKAPAEYLVIDSVQRPKPNQP